MNFSRCVYFTFSICLYISIVFFRVTFIILIDLGNVYILLYINLLYFLLHKFIKYAYLQI